MINTNPVTVWPSLLTSIPLIFIILSYNVSVTLGFYVALADVYKYFTWGFHWFIKYMLKHRVGKCLTVGIIKSSLVKDITQVLLRYRWSRDLGNPRIGSIFIQKYTGEMYFSFLFIMFLYPAQKKRKKSSQFYFHELIWSIYYK